MSRKTIKSKTSKKSGERVQTREMKEDDYLIRGMVHQEGSEELPYLWTEDGTILKRKRSETWPAMSEDRKYAWSESESGHVGWWAYTLPPKTLQFVSFIRGNVEALEKFNDDFEPALQRNHERFHLGPLRDSEKGLMLILKWVDDVAQSEAWSENKADHWGFKPRADFHKSLDDVAMQKMEVVHLLGSVLFDCIAQRGESRISFRLGKEKNPYYDKAFSGIDFLAQLQALLLKAKTTPALTSLEGNASGRHLTHDLVNSVSER